MFSKSSLDTLYLPRYFDIFLPLTFREKFRFHFLSSSLSLSLSLSHPVFWVFVGNVWNSSARELCRDSTPCTRGHALCCCCSSSYCCWREKCVCDFSQAQRARLPRYSILSSDTYTYFTLSIRLKCNINFNQRYNRDIERFLKYL